MNHKNQFHVSRNLVLQIGDSGELVATNSMSRDPVTITSEMLCVLRSFSRPTNLDSAFETEQNTGFAKELFTEIFHQLVRLNLLTPAADSPTKKEDYAFARGHFSLAPVHYNLIRDYVRTMSYRTAIERNARDKVVVDLGSGSGILAIFAAKAGAKKVYAIEESGIADIAQSMFEKNGCDDVIELYRGNSKDIQLPERADIIIHELLYHDAFHENFVPYVEDAKNRFLKSGGGRLIPFRVDVCCIGLEPDMVPSFARRVALGVKEFAPAYGLDFDPVLQHIESSAHVLNDWEGWPHSRNEPGREYFYENMLSAEVTLRSVDFYGDIDKSVAEHVQVKMPIIQGGRLGSVVIFFRACLDEQISLTSSPFSPKTSWRWKVQDLSRTIDVSAGDEIELVSTLRLFMGRQKLFVDLA